MARRLGAIVYDAVLLFAVLFAATALLLAAHGGHAIAPGNLAYLAYLLAWTFVYFGWFWTRGGQTLGMRAWGLRVECEGGGALSWRHAARRFAAAGLSWACAGAGFAWMLVDDSAKCWHDRLSDTALVSVDARNHTTRSA